ncbi:carbonic anhydrase [Pseudoclavibacter sp. 13-3]|uniref:carbonic anhydrase n=1 Tax=Pseudoclavibacter sp. 13-3 TaxID=2901228 RepID=UPI001E481677|nr:carbonic anhydrase [Pseudoclavibacter sp. 13-3]MCD7102214.1 carbonic anhydrase [Pseudoclavibacter sp. 13-3]
MSELELGTPQEVWDELQEGNDRFATMRCRHPHRDEARRQELLTGQSPKAVVLGCGDSRVPAEIVFDAGLGDLFVVRNAGAVIGTSILGSIEFAVGSLHVPLVMVMGHESCGAIAGAIAAADPEQPTPPGYFLEELLHRIKPAVTQAGRDGDTSPRHIGELQVENTVQAIMERSELVAAAVSRGETAVVGSIYDLSTSRVRAITARGLDLGQSVTSTAGRELSH